MYDYGEQIKLTLKLLCFLLTRFLSFCYAVVPFQSATYEWMNGKLLNMLSYFV